MTPILKVSVPFLVAAKNNYNTVINIHSKLQNDVLVVITVKFFFKF